MYDLKKIEKKWQKKWEKAKIFEGNPNSSKKKKFITVPYPYASGPMHIGHGRSYVNGDIFARYYRAKGYNVLFPIAFHITGTPVLAISSAIKNRNKKMKDLMREYIYLHTSDSKKIEKILSSFQDPWNIVNYFSKSMLVDLKTLGMSMDWRRTFTTGDKIYNKFIEWQFDKLYDKGYIEKGSYPILYCPKCESAAGEDDIQSGDEKNLSINKYIGIKFQLNDYYLVASTLRPETLFGVTNIWINPEEIYVEVQVEGENWIISKHSVEILENQGKSVSINREFIGEDLLAKKVKNPINRRDLLILPASFVDTEIATGIVYSVPAHAPFDLIALRDLKKDIKTINRYNLDEEEIQNLQPLKIINLKDISRIPAEFYIEKYHISNQNETEKLEQATAENYRQEFYHGTLNSNCDTYSNTVVPKAVSIIVDKLDNENKITKIYYPVTPNLMCRCGAKIVISLLEDQWFINFNAGNWKNQARNCLNKLIIAPKKYRLNFENIFEWLNKRPCARKRGLGTSLPFDNDWIIESLSDSTIYMAFYTIVNTITENKIPPEKLTLKLFDFIFLNKGEIDEIAEITGITKDLIIKMKNEFFYWYPVDHRHTAIMHISNHLSFYIFHHVAIFSKHHWPKCITLIEPVIVEGNKMGKSKGNVISLAEIKQNYSIDLFRFFISQSADLGIKLDWREKQIKTVKKHLNNFINFVDTSLNKIPNFQKNIQKIRAWYPKVINSICAKKFKEAEKALRNFDLREYLQQSFYETFNILKELKKYSYNKSEFLEVIKMILPKWIKLLSPTIPHICEEIWHKMGYKGFISLEKWDFHKNININQNNEIEYEYIQNLIGDIKNIQKVLKTEEVEKINIYTAPNWKIKVNNLIMKHQGDFHKILDNIKKSETLIKKKETIPYLKSQIRSWNSKPIINLIDEKIVLKEAKKYLENRLKLSIAIDSDYDPKSRKKNATPMKPAIYIS
ncbi:MAG: leucine--tRNA ligase [Candidatus Lokiarchaeota archaeon]|nr:leucine--tRNA ligase [Candidatus Lokiarchaeota archaeon]MBD3198471.1 leucine--tRNA ligase [Candidatus Lokiarchaeota archaeon]